MQKISLHTVEDLCSIWIDNKKIYNQELGIEFILGEKSEKIEEFWYSNLKEE